MTENPDTAAHLEELAQTLASHGDKLAALRMAELEQKVSPFLGSPVPIAPRVTMGGDVSQAGVSGAWPAALLYGDGSDGNVTISADTELYRDTFYLNLTVNSTKKLNANGFRVFVQGVLTNNGVIHHDGGDGGAGGTTTNGDGGVAPSAGTLAGGGYGGIGGSGAGEQALYSLGGVGGAGGNGGAGGSTVGPGPTVGTIRDLSTAAVGRFTDGTKVVGGAGGGGGGYPGGGGGAGGGTLVVVARTIENANGAIRSNGGHGGEAVSGGGGGGGGGGVVVLIYGLLYPGTETAAGGAFGVGYPNGAAGASGLVIKTSA